MASDRAIPIQGIYSASKHAIKGFTDALRMEVEEQGAPISVTLIKPASIGTPMPQHVKNYTGSEPKFPPPIYSPEDVARVILHAAAHPTRDAFVGSAARTISSFSQFAPRTMDRLSERALFKAQLGPKPPSPGDNLWHGQAEGKVHGDHQGSLIRPSLYSNAALHPAVTAAVAGAALAGMGYLMRRGRGTARRADGRSWLRQPGHRLSSDEAGAGADQIEARADGDIGLEADRGEGYSEGPGGQASGRVDHPSRHGTIPQHAEQLPDDLIVPLDGTRDEEARTTDRIQTF
jgi:hypothetical protein